MDRLIACQVQLKTVAYAKLINLTSPAADFFEDLSKKDKARVQRLFELLAAQGRIANPHHSVDLGAGLRELKCFQIRIPFLHSKRSEERNVIILTHGFFKKQPKTPKTEIDRAWRIFEEDQARNPGKPMLLAKHNKPKLK